MPFQERWKARERLKRGQSIYGDGIGLVSPSTGPSEGSWRATPAAAPEDATTVAFRFLGLAEATATEDDVKKRYHELALKAHPDVGGDAKKFHEVVNAKNLCLAAIKVRRFFSLN